MTAEAATSSARAGGYAKGRARRRQIIDAATRLFGEVGYRSASLREIATRAGISHPGLLHHFPTKEALLLAVLQHRDELYASKVAPDVGDGLVELRHLVAQVGENMRQRGVVELFVALSSEAVNPAHPAHMYFVDRYRETLTETTRVYGLLREQGALRPDIQPAAAAAQLIAMMDGLQVQWLLDGGETDMEAVLRAHVAVQLTVPL